MRIIEARKASPPKTEQEISLGTFKRLAGVVNRFSVFASEITGEDLLRFKECELQEPLKTENIALVAFVFSVLANHRILPNDWAKRTVLHKQLYNAKKGNYPSIGYLTTAASRLIGLPNKFSSFRGYTCL